MYSPVIGRQAGSAVDDRKLTAAGREYCRRSNDAHGVFPGQPPHARDKPARSRPMNVSGFQATSGGLAVNSGVSCSFVEATNR